MTKHTLVGEKPYHPKTKITAAQIAEWSAALGLSGVAEAKIRRMNESDPVRMDNGSRSVRGTFPSSIMGTTLQFGSRTCELSFLWDVHLPFLRNAERSLVDGTRMILCQPTWLDLSAEPEGKKKIAYKYPPDYFLMTKDWAGFIECKWLEELEWLIDPSNPRNKRWLYNKISDDHWVSPPAEKAAEQYGLKHRIWVMSKNRVTRINNLAFLAEYFEQAKGNFNQDSARRIEGIVKGDPGIKFRDILAVLDPGEVDTLYFCLTRQQLYVDIDHEPIAPNFTARVFLNEECAAETLTMEAVTAEVTVDESAGSEMLITPGTKLTLDGKGATIVRTPPGLIVLQIDGAEEPDTMTTSEFERHVVSGRAQQVREGPKVGDFSEAMIEWRLVGPDEWPTMNERHNRIKSFLNASPRSRQQEPARPNRTEYRYIRSFHEAEAKYGDGFGVLGLRCEKRSGNRNSKLDSDASSILQNLIEEYYLTDTAPSVELVWGECERRCAAFVPPLKPPCRKTILEYIRKYGQVKVALARAGQKAAYALGLPFWDTDFDDITVDGEFAWAVGHIDHTQLDSETAPTADGLSLGRPWLTMMIAPRHRRVLAIVISYEPPSYRSCMAVIEECVRRHHRLPAIIVTDGGKEFSSNYFSQLLARFRIVQAFRPPAKPRFGSVLERTNRIINSRLIHNLPGNTKITVNVRMIVKSHDPKRLATLTLEQLEEAVLAFAYEWHDLEPDPITGLSPRQRYEEDLKKGGPRTHRMIVPNADFYIQISPTTKTGFATVKRDGVTVNYLPYVCAEFRRPGMLKKKLRVRYSHSDLSVIWVRIDRKWVKCRCRTFQREFKGLTERELRLATTLLLAASKTLKEKRRAVNAKRLAEFFHDYGLSRDVQLARARARKNADAVARRTGSASDGGQQPDPHVPEEGDATNTDNNVPIAPPVPPRKITPIKIQKRRRA